MNFICAFLITALFAFAALGRAATWPASCGPAQTSFDVQTRKSAAAPAKPASGKAQVVFLEDENQPLSLFMYATVRFAMDGAWVGATRGTSHFVLDVDPGEHHLCANWQSALPQFKKNLDLSSFTAEPGKTYYFSAHVTVASRDDILFGLARLNPDEGSYKESSTKLAISKPK